MKIKIIDLLIKIANNEEVPKKIKYEDEIWECSKEEYYSCKDGRILLGDLFFNYKIQTFINDEVEIIEEPKKIEYEQIEELTCNEFDFEKKTINSLIKNQRKLIDEINNLKEK